MPDEQDDTKADGEPAVPTSLHAYKEGREEDVEGDVEKLTSGDPKQLQQDKIADDDEDLGPPAHEKV